MTMSNSLTRREFLAAGAASAVALRSSFAADVAAPAPSQAVSLRIDCSKPIGPLKPVWRYFGHDEPNYTYMKDGQKLLSQLAAINPNHTVNVRTHNLLCTGDGTPAYKWGSTNAYTEDPAGNPVYDWTITDRIFDTYMQRKIKPYVQIGFTPKALSTHPDPYQHSWRPGRNYNEVYTGWAYPPKDYGK